MWAEIQAFLNKPFDTQGSAVQWFAFIGLILASLWLWHTIARDFGRIEAEA